MHEDIDFLKQDINMLENPLWFQDARMAQHEGSYVWKGMDGYTYRAGYKIPTKTDYIFLLYLLGRCQNEDWNCNLELSRYEILRGIGLGKGKWWYSRLEESLKRWRYVGLEFKGIFYNGSVYESLAFGIIDYWGINEKTKKVEIHLNKIWILKIKNSLYYKAINFDKIKALSSPRAIRLYEILIKSFQSRQEWKIDAIKLAKKIPLQEKYASKIVNKIKISVNHIRSKIGFPVYLELDKKNRGTIILVFRLKRDSQPNKQGEPLMLSPTIQKDEHPSEVPSEIINIIPPQYLKLVQDVILKTLKEKEVEYIRKAIEYVNSMDPSNYCAYLATTLKNGYGDSFDPEAKKYIGIKKESQSCYNKYKGSCGASWDTHKDNKTSVCYWCKKFDRSRIEAFSTNQ